MVIIVLILPPYMLHVFKDRTTSRDDLLLDGRTCLCQMEYGVAQRAYEQAVSSFINTSWKEVIPPRNCMKADVPP